MMCHLQQQQQQHNNEPDEENTWHICQTRVGCLNTKRVGDADWVANKKLLTKQQTLQANNDDNNDEDAMQMLKKTQ